MLTILAVILIFAVTTTAAYYLPDYYRVRINEVKALYNLKRLKPFDCEPCLAFWLTAFFTMLATGFIVGLLMGAVSFKLTCYLVIKYKL